MTGEERAIRELIEAWQAATKAGDVERVLSLMADDVVFTVAGRPPFGKPEFAAGMQQQQGVVFEARQEILEVEVSGDLGFARTRLSVSMTPPGGEPVRRAGHTLTIFRRQQGGRWVLYRDANLLAKE